MGINRLSVVEERVYFDARAHGCKCDECPLRSQRPVGPEVRPNAVFTIVGESPGENEEREGRPFIGASGYLINKSLKQLGLQRTDVHVTNALLCRPKPKMSPAEWDQALAACAPRLDAELGGTKTSAPRTILAAGAKALQVLTGKANITPWMGGPLGSKFGPVIPSIHPAFALRKPSYIPVFKTMLARAAKLALGQWQPWVWPEYHADEHDHAGRLSALRHLLVLAARGVPISVDIENLPSSGVFRCIGVGTTDLVVSVPTPFNSADEEKLVREILASPALKIYHNSQHDVLELSSHGFALGGDIYDTLLAHAVVAPQLAHDLGFVAAVEFPAERWKSEFKVTGEDKGKTLLRFERAPLSELLPYNAKDVAATALLRLRLNQRLATTHNGQALYDEYLALDAVAMKMRQRGVQVDPTKFAGHRELLNEELWKIAIAFRQIVRDEQYVLGVNGQHPSLNKLFFGVWQCPPVSYSEETGKPSLDGKTLTHYVSFFDGKVRDVQETARLILRYRKYAKLLGSYIENLPIDMANVVHPTWRIFGARTGRWSATDPAFQTIPKPNKAAGTPGMRDLFCARPGHILIEADYSQLELRIVALLSGDEKLLQWYADGVDVHTLNARAVFKVKDPTKQQRDLAKRVVYGMNYGGGAETIWKTLVVDFPGLTVGAVEYVMKRWFEEHPAIEIWQRAQIELARERCYVEESLSGRRQYYHDGNIKPTEVLNYPIQGAAGTLANRAVRQIATAYDWKTQFLLAQVHDSTLSEVHETALGGSIEIVRNAMEQEVTLAGRTVKFPVDVSTGRNWAFMEKAA